MKYYVFNNYQIDETMLLQNVCNAIMDLDRITSIDGLE